MFVIKQNDTLPPLVAILQEPDGTPIDLSPAVGVSLVIKSETGSTSWKKSAIIVDEPAGKVQYDWVALDTAVANTYNGEFEIDWGAGLQTVPNKNYFQILIVPDLG